jgi:two-component system sporulation sensor kinase B
MVLLNDFAADLILHFLIMMIIPFTNNLLSHQKAGMKSPSFLMIALIFSLFLTMAFPVTIAGDQSFDLKFIPVFVAYFYIHPAAGIITIIALIGFKAIFSAGSLLIMTINYSVIAVLFYLASKYYQKCSFRQKLCLAAVFYVPITITRYLIFIQEGLYGDAIYLILFSIVSIVTISMIIYLIEIDRLQAAMMEKLKSADKLNAISQLAASVAHEIRNPMTTVRGFLQILKDDQNLTSDQSTFISVSLDELDRTNHIINDFLSLARPDSSISGKVVLSATLFEVADFMRPYALMAKVEIKTKISDGIFINGNRNELKQLFINLIKNSIEAMPDGGILEVSAFEKGSTAYIQIKDEGIGLSQKQLSMLGQPYYSTKTKGTGLGLMISFDIIKRMKGEYIIDSLENDGTTFTIIFPLFKLSDERIKVSLDKANSAGRHQPT